jgi:hypothetical protein
LVRTASTTILNNDGCSDSFTYNPFQFLVAASLEFFIFSGGCCLTGEGTCGSPRMEGSVGRVNTPGMATAPGHISSSENASDKDGSSSSAAALRHSSSPRPFPWSLGGGDISLAEKQMLTEAHLLVLGFHIMLVVFVGFCRARVDERFLLPKQMRMKAHLSVLGCRFVSLQ